MNKYYVRWGQLETVLMAESPKDAARLSITRSNGETLGYFCYVDTRGHRGPICNPEDPDVSTIDTNFLPQWTIPYGEIVNES